MLKRRPSSSFGVPLRNLSKCPDPGDRKTRLSVGLWVVSAVRLSRGHRSSANRQCFPERGVIANIVQLGIRVVRCGIAVPRAGDIQAVWCTTPFQGQIVVAPLGQSIAGSTASAGSLLRGRRCASSWRCWPAAWHASPGWRGPRTAMPTDCAASVPDSQPAPASPRQATSRPRPRSPTGRSSPGRGNVTIPS